MNVVEMISLFATMVVLAAIPSASVLLVLTRSVTHGTANGMAVGAGIVLGDLVFIALVLLGLSFVAETLGTLFVAVRYLGGMYLIWLGISLLRRSPGTVPNPNAAQPRGGLAASFVAGLLLTLGDVKAIFFYLSLLPVFVDLAALQTADVMRVVAITIVAVGGTKCVYAVFARRVFATVQRRGLANASTKAAGAALVGAGGVIVVKA